MKQIEQSIINLENNIESVQGDLCERSLFEYHRSF